MDGFGKVEGDALVLAITLIEPITHFDGAIYPMLFGMTIKDERAIWWLKPVWKEGFDSGTTINNYCPYYHCTKSCWPNIRFKLDVRVEEIKAIVME